MGGWSFVGGRGGGCLLERLYEKIICMMTAGSLDLYGFPRMKVCDG